MGETWDPSAPGIVRLPSGRLVRGRGLGRPAPDSASPAFGVYLLGRRGRPLGITMASVAGLPAARGRGRGAAALTEAWQRAVTERVEIACAGGRGRTGTALACLAILDGVPNFMAVAFVREHYDPGAVETFQQRRYVARWHGQADDPAAG